jgi:hypothetical protein
MKKVLRCQARGGADDKLDRLAHRSVDFLRERKLIGVEDGIAANNVRTGGIEPAVFGGVVLGEVGQLRGVLGVRRDGGFPKALREKGGGCEFLTYFSGSGHCNAPIGRYSAPRAVGYAVLFVCGKR